MAESGIYEIVNCTNGKRYIGSAINLKARWSRHKSALRSGKHHCAPLLAAWQKYGEDRFHFAVIEHCQKDDLITREQFFIDKLDPEYNASKIAGFRTFLGRKHSPETIAKMRAAHLGKPGTTIGRCRSPEAIAASANAHRGKKRSAETRQKIAEKAKGRKFVRHNDDYRAKLSAALKGKMPSDEHMAKLQAGRAAYVPTDEQRAKTSASLKKAYAEGRHSRERTPEHRAKISRSLVERGRRTASIALGDVP